MTKSYPSRVDRWLGVLLAGLALSVPASLVAALAASSSADAAVFAASGAFTAALLGLVVWPVRYVTDDDALVVRFGAIRVRIAYADIEEIAPTRTPLAGPALSLDRLMIRHRGGTTLVSPADAEAFLRDIASRDPGLALAAGRITRRAKHDAP